MSQSGKIYCTPEQMREIENKTVETGTSLYDLMENAGAVSAACILREMSARNIHGKVAVLCGGGNNGGDGLAIARNLIEAGIRAHCIMTCSKAATELAAKEMEILFSEGKVNVVMPEDGIDAALDLLFDSSVIVDAVFGIGFHDELPEDIAHVLKYADSCDAFKIAIDVPSGGNCKTGTVSDGTIKCDLTLTFGAEKIGTALSPLKEYCGKVTVCDINIPECCIESTDGILHTADAELVKKYLLPRAKDSHKGTFGKVLNVAGSANMSGAALLSSEAALRSGAGLVELASSDSVVNAAAASLYECIYKRLKAGKNGEISADNAAALISEMKSCSACMTGCGLSVSENTKKLVKELINNAEIPLIIDADGLNCVADCIDIIRNAKGGAAVTPHPGELSRMLGISIDEITADRLGAAVRFNSLYETPVLIKGSPTFIIGNDSAYVSFTGNPGLARGGSGDVLTGIAAAFAGMGIPLTEALACAAYVHGRAADMAAEEFSETGMLPRDVIAHLPFVFKEMDR